MVNNDRNVGVLFGINNKKVVTLIDSRSKNRFKRLIKNWAIEGKLVENPKKEDNFSFVELDEILNDIENTYKDLQNTPAVSRISSNVFKLINTIRVQNEIDYDLDSYEDDDKEGD